MFIQWFPPLMDEDVVHVYNNEILLDHHKE